MSWKGNIVRLLWGSSATPAKPEVQEEKEKPSHEGMVPVDTWQVKWTRRYGSYSHETEPTVAAFTSLSAAESFAEKLSEAFTLIRYKGHAITRIEIKKGDSDGDWATYAENGKKHHYYSPEKVG